MNKVGLRLNEYSTEPCVSGPAEHYTALLSLSASTLTNLFFFLSALFSWFLLSPVGTPRTSQG